jgi:gliding motility-associated-like protein
LGFTITSNAQLVITIAGVLDSVGALNGPALQSHFNNPHGIAVDGFGNVYVADRFGHRIRKITTGGIATTLAGSGNSGTLDGNGVNAEFNEPWGLCADSLGNVYVADTRNNLIRKIDLNGNVTTLAGSGSFGTTNGPALGATFGNPTGIEIDETTGTIYVADHLTHIIRKIDPAGNVSTLAGAPYLTGNTNGVGLAATFNRPYGLTLDNSGNILVADEWNHLIRKVTPTGVVTTVAGNGVIGSSDGTGANVSFNYPWDITVDNNGNIFVADGYNDVIRKIDPSANVSTYVGTAGNSGATDGTGPAATFNGATGIAYFDDTDELYVADAYNELIRKIINLNIQSIALQLTTGNSTVICEGDTIGFRAAPEIYSSYDFFIAGNLVQSSTSEFFETSSLSPGNYFFSVIAYDNTGNSINSSDVFVQVLAAPNPTLTVVGNTAFFDGDSATLIASAGDSYLWNTNQTIGAITVYNTGAYWVDVTNSNGCVGRSDTINIDVTPFSIDPEIEIIEGTISTSQDGSTGTVCFGSAALLRSSYNNGNQWFRDGFPISGATSFEYLADESGEYQVEVLDSLGFTLFSNTIDIVLLPKQINNFISNPLTPTPNQTVQYIADVSSQVTNYFWNFGDANAGADNFSNLESPTHAYANVGLYTVSLITSDLVGCTDTMTRVDYIDVTTDGSGSGGGGGNPNPNDGDVFIPTAFTPNGDNSNDIFYVRGGSITELNMSIYNQWGERVFYSDDQAVGWDATFSGREVQLGTYVYVVKLQFTDGTENTYNGKVTVLR